MHQRKRRGRRKFMIFLVRSETLLRRYKYNVVFVSLGFNF